MELFIPFLLIGGHARGLPLRLYLCRTPTSIKVYVHRRCSRCREAAGPAYAGNAATNVWRIRLAE